MLSSTHMYDLQVKGSSALTSIFVGLPDWQGFLENHIISFQLEVRCRMNSLKFGGQRSKVKVTVPSFLSNACKMFFSGKIGLSLEFTFSHIFHSHVPPLYPGLSS